MTEELALLKVILAYPEEDLPRKILADYWEENGQSERAEFVQVQCDLARIDEPPITIHTGKPCAFGLADPNCPRCKFGLDLIHEQRLLHDSILRWVPQPLRSRCQTETKGAIGQVGPAGGPRLIFVRGFISEIICSWEDFVRYEPDLLWWPTRKCERCGGTKLMKVGNNDRPEGIVPCSACRGKGEISGATDVCPDKPWKQPGLSGPTCFTNECKKCSGSGRIPRLVRPTYQPITRVELTNWPFGADTTIDRSRVLEELRERYPPIREWVRR